jgi:tetratricopeptide (TPR) repeat protein
LISLSVSAQTEITLKDSEEIKLAAKRKVEKGLQDLLNTIVQEDIGDAERKQIIRDSYTAGSNKLFYSNEAIIEDDINPSNTALTEAKDFSVEKYLNSLDIFYSKGIGPNIILSDITISNVKKSDNLYIKVYFQSTFKGSHSEIKKGYDTHRRLAELRVEKVGKKWMAYITRISFQRSVEAVLSTENDLSIVVPKVDTTQFAGDTVAIAKAVEAFKQKEEENRQKEEEERKREEKELERYESIKKNGLTAYNDSDYELALQAFNEAERINKTNLYSDYEPIRWVSKTKKTIAIEKEKQRRKMEEEKYRSTITNAVKFEKRRHYAEALSLFREAFKVYPDSATQYSEKIKNLNAQLRVKTELEEKYTAGNYKLLIDDYSRLLKTTQDNSDYFLGRGKCYLALNEPKRAIQDFNKAIDLDFENAEAFLFRAQYYEQLKELAKAVADYTNFLNLVPDSASIHVKRAELRVQLNNQKAAFEDYDRALQLQPRNANYLFDRGMLHYRNSNFSKAIDDFTQVVSITPTQTYAFYFRGMGAYYQKQYERAGQDFAICRKLKIEDRFEKDIEQLSNDFYNKGILQFGKNDLDSSLLYFSNSIALKYDNWSSWFKKGEVLSQKVEYPKAIACYDSATKYYTNFSDAIFRRGQARYELKNFLEAIVDFKKTIEIANNFYSALLEEARSYIQIQDYKSAIMPLQRLKIVKKELEKTPNVYPKNFLFELHQFLGRSMYETKYFKESIPEFDEALNYNPNFADSYYFRGLANFEIGEYKDAANNFQKSIQSDPQHYRYLAKAKTLFQAQKYPEAIIDFENTLRLDSLKQNYFEAQQLKGYCELKTMKYIDAYQSYTKAEQHDSTKCDQYFYRDLAQIGLFMAMPQETNRCLLKGFAQNPINADLLYTKACYYVLQKEETEALVWFRKVFETKQFNQTILKKDKLLSTVNPAFKDNKDFKALLKEFFK